jgi:hypothetical protein
MKKLPRAGTIVGPFRLRQDKYKCSVASIYWRVSDGIGETRQETFYWGKLSTATLEKILPLLSKPDRNARKQVAKFLGIDPGDLTREKLAESNFIRASVLNHLKINERQKSEAAKRFWNEIIAPKVELIREAAERWRLSVLVRANALRDMGLAWNLATQKERFHMRDVEEFKDSIPPPMTVEQMRYALSIWRRHQAPIINWKEASKILNEYPGGLIE